jgi:hypothetical protein
VRRAAASLALIVASCTAPPPPSPSAVVDQAQAQIAANLREDPDDAELIARLGPGVIERRGHMLLVRAGGRTARYTEHGYCEGYQTCARFRADALLHGRFLAVRMFHGEYPHSYLIHDLERGGVPFDTGERPVAGPVAPLAAVADAGEINEPIIGGLAVVDIERQQLLWHRRDWYQDARIDGWEGGRCVRASFLPGGDASRRTVWIAETAGRWTAAQSPPEACARG